MHSFGIQGVMKDGLKERMSCVIGQDRMIIKKRDSVMEKVVIIINGRGGVGKDTLCDLAAKHFKVKNISAITPIKEIAQNYGWNGQKDSRSRKFLSDLKRVFIDYNDLPTKYLYEQYRIFLDDDNQFLFIHIREKEEIEKLKKLIDIKCLTLLIQRNQNDIKKWGNASDDEVENYEYDLCYNNDRSLIETEKEFVAFLEKLLV